MKKEIWVLLYSEYSFLNGFYPLHVEPLSRYQKTGSGEHPNTWKIIAQGAEKEIIRILEEKHKEIQRGIGSVRFIDSKRDETIQHIMLLPCVDEYQDLPREAGIYFVAYEDEIIYIGKSIDMYERWNRKHKMKDMEFTSIHYLIYKNSNIKRMDTDETAYISILCPKYNEIVNYAKINHDE